MKKSKENWVIITKGRGGDRFYPLHQIRQALGATVIPYSELSSKPLEFWVDKNVIFHLVWVKEHMLNWVGYFEEIKRTAKNFWIEFDADQYMNDLSQFDKTCGWTGEYFTFWNKIVARPAKLIWELPNKFMPFYQYQRTIAKIGLYDVKWEQPISTEKPIDILGLIDSKKRNGLYTLALLDEINKEYSRATVKCIVNNRSFYREFKNKVSFELIYNGKFSGENEEVFHGLLEKSKIYVELSDRITLGRNMYEAVFYGCSVLCPNTYGVSDQLPEENVVDVSLLNYMTHYEQLTYMLVGWRSEDVVVLREHLKERSSIIDFANELKEKSQ